MSLQFDVWPPGAWALVEDRERQLRHLYGRVAGPVRDALVRYTATVFESDPSELVDAFLRRLPASASSDGLSRTLGVPAPEAATPWWPGQYRRCEWNPLHLIRTTHEDACLVCGTADGGEDALMELLTRRDHWAQEGPLDSWPEQRVPFLPSLLAGRKIVKIAPHAGRVVTLHPDGSLTETDLDRNGLSRQPWAGEWGCDSYGLLVVSVGSYLLCVAGRGDGLCPGIEIRSPEVGEPTARFVVGVEDLDGQGLRAIKWVSALESSADQDSQSDQVRAFRLTRTTPLPWDEASLMDESDLFPFASGWGERSTWTVARRPLTGGLLQLRSTDPDGVRYVSELHAIDPTDSWPAGTWVGRETCDRHAAERFVAVMPVACLQPFPAGTGTHGSNPL